MDKAPTFLEEFDAFAFGVFTLAQTEQAMPHSLRSTRMRKDLWYRSVEHAMFREIWQLYLFYGSSYPKNSVVKDRLAVLRKQAMMISLIT